MVANFQELEELSLWYCQSHRDVSVLREALIEQGIRLLYEDRYPHANSPDTHGVFFEGPERFKVEVVAPISAELSS